MFGRGKWPGAAILSRVTSWNREVNHQSLFKGYICHFSAQQFLSSLTTISWSNLCSVTENQQALVGIALKCFLKTYRHFGASMSVTQ